MYATEWAYWQVRDNSATGRQERMREMSGKGFISVEPDGKCELCGKIAELRPYGPRGERICFDCAMKDEETAKRQFSCYVLGETVN